MLVEIVGQLEARVMEIHSTDGAYLQRGLAVARGRRAWGTVPNTDMTPILFDDATPESMFREWTRMSRATFAALHDELVRTADYSSRYNAQGVPRRGGRGHPIKTTLRQEMCIALYALSGADPYSRVHAIFGVGSKSQVSDIVNRFVRAVCRLETRHIVWPTGARLREVVDGFESVSWLPGCCGLVDGTHIHILAPADCPSNYNSYKMMYTMVLQAVVDQEGLFTHVFAGCPGACNDRRVMRMSSLPQLLVDTCLVDPASPGKYIIGDNGYSLRPYMLVGHHKDTLNLAERVTNAYIDKTRVGVENAFSRLKGRFR